MQALFISDLHLTPDRPAITKAFIHFLKTKALEVKELYILGDFFDYWVGDDAAEVFHKKIAKMMREYKATGRQIFFMVGNRDFAIGQNFLQEMGVHLLKEPAVIQFNNERILLMHGDLLCVKDVSYQLYRRIIRHPWVLSLLSALPINFRRKLGEKIRSRSQVSVMKKAINIMDVTSTAVANMVQKYQTRFLIHGHTHQPAIHPITGVNINHSKRYVLGDWGELGWFISMDHQGLQLHSFSIT